MKKRTFLKNIGIASFAPLLHTQNSGLQTESDSTVLPNHFDSEEAFWTFVRNQYELHPDFINLESGTVIEFLVNEKVSGFMVNNSIKLAKIE